MKSFIRKLSASAEFSLVLLVCFWWAIYGGIISISTHSWSDANQFQQPFAGIGVELGTKNNKVIIMQVVPNAPAARAGLSSGLVIQKIDGTATAGKSPEDCRDMMRGVAGSKVKLELVDTINNKTNTVEVTRESIQGVPRGHVTDRRAFEVAGVELLGLAVTFWIARVRGWPLGAWGFQFSWKLVGAGILLCLATMLIVGIITTLANTMLPAGTIHRYLHSQLSLPLLIIFVIVNPVFEEIMETGYFIQFLQRHGMWSAVFVSAFFRAFLHAYQGINALLIVFPIGLIFGFVYWKWRRLWPLFVAHILFDLYALFPGLHGN
jgi:membrane protease YdiL (CAAX protease family)